MKPLKDGDHPLASVLRAASTLEDDDATSLLRMRARLQASRGRRHGSRALVFAAAAGVFMVGLLTHRLLRSPSEAEAHWTWVDLEGGQATSSGDTLTVGAGALAMQVSHQQRVVTPQAELNAAQARFHLLVAASGTTTVSVEEGAVVVRPKEGPQVALSMGGRWTSALATEPDDATFHRRAIELERTGRPLEALVVLEGLSTRETVWGELALYDAARLCVAMGESDRARSFLSSHDERFGVRGVLRKEVAALREQL
jgi:hypothetical protein